MSTVAFWRRSPFRVAYRPEAAKAGDGSEPLAALIVEFKLRLLYRLGVGLLTRVLRQARINRDDFINA